MSEIKRTKTGKPIGDHEVGYGRPPKKSQFKKGQSGNPKGRSPKPEKEPVDMVRDLLRREIPIREGGETRSISFLEAFLTDWSNKALGGRPKDKADYYKMLRDNFPEALKPAEPESVRVDKPPKPLRLIYPEATKPSEAPADASPSPMPNGSPGDRS